SDDGGAEATTLTYTVTSLPGGTLTVNGHPVTATGTTFTQADLDAGQVTYTPGGSDSNDNFGFSVEDSAAAAPVAATGTFRITVRDDDVRVTANSGLAVSES